MTLGALFVCIFLLETVPGSITGLMALGLMVYVPVVVYRRLKSTYFATNGLMTLSGLWLEGILHFVCGSIIFALGTLIFMKWIVPGYLPAVAAQLSTLIENNPGAIAGSDVTPQQISSYFSSIRPIDISMTLLWAASFTGSIASLVIAAIVKSKRIPPSSSPNQ